MYVIQHYITCVTSVFSMSRDNVTLASYLSVLDTVVVSSFSVLTYFTFSSGTPAMFADSLIYKHYCMLWTAPYIEQLVVRMTVDDGG